MPPPFAPHHAALVALALCACGGPIVQYDGDTFPPIAPPAVVDQVEVLPHDHVAIGMLRASCHEERVDGRGTTVTTDLPCSERLLHQHMRDRAAEVGGSTLVAPACTSTVGESPEGDDDSGWATRRSVKAACVATVARPRHAVPRADASAPRPASAERMLHIVEQGIPVDVIVRPAPHAPRLPPRDVASVQRGYAPAADGRLLAQVRSRCQKPCERSVAEQVLLQGGAQVGADLITDVRCLSIRAGVWGCDAAAVKE